MPSDSHELRAAAWLSAAAHAIGLALALLAMRQGTPGVPVLERISYLAARPPGWVAGWVVWMACAVSLVVFLRVLARTWRSPLTRAAAWIGLAGAMIDISCDAVYAWVAPARAAGEVAAFLTFERRLGMASLVGANGLYTVAIALATLGLRAAGPAARGLGALTVAGGVVLAVAGVCDAPALVAAGTALTIPAFMAWTLVSSYGRPRG